MKLNCKPGDLAVVVSVDVAKDEGGARSEIAVVDIRGAVFRCISLFELDGIPHWNVERRRVTFKGVTYSGSAIGGQLEICGIPDSILRPIRDQSGEDETLTWAGKPQEVTE